MSSKPVSVPESRYESKVAFRLTFGLIVMVVGFLAGSSADAQSNALWRSAGQNIKNTRHAERETKITPDNVSQLVPKWIAFTEGDISATPAVDGNSVYVPDWAGNVYRFDAATGEEIWHREISEYTGKSFSFSRVTPAVAGDLLIFGTQKNLLLLNDLTTPAQVIAVARETGDLVWITDVDMHPASIITQSAVVFGDMVFVGVSSLEETFAGFVPGYPCCSFRGSLVALDKNTGEILWKSYTAPEGKGFTGNSVWGSTPVVDTRRNSVYVTTGNNYTAPQEVLDCVEAGGPPATIRDCVEAVDGSSENYFDAFVAFDMNTGAVKWHTSVLPFDAWTAACFPFFDPTNCPNPAGPDYDFGQGPALYTTRTHDGKNIDLLGAGQKSGIYWALNPDNGDLVWSRQAGPGGETGGLQWGSATDGERIYTAVSNSNFLPWQFIDGSTVNGGFWSTLDAATGQILWQTAGTTEPVVGPFTFPPPDAVANNMGPVTVANGVVFAGALDEAGTMYAFDAQDGEILWSFESGGSVNSGAAVVNGTVYWGSGYSYFGLLGTPNDKLYAFAVSSEIAEAGSGQTNTLKAAAIEASGLPKDYELDENYPNPFNPSTRIGFALPEAGQVRLSVYDMLGHEVRRLVDGVREAGRHEATFNAGNLSSGTYLYRLETPQGSMQRVMLLLK